MRSLLAFFLLPFALLPSKNAEAQDRAGDWRVAKKVFIASNGQKFNYEYDYTSDGRIQAVRSFSASGLLQQPQAILNLAEITNQVPTPLTITGKERSSIFLYDMITMEELLNW